jgi:hypothetical protein
MMNLVLIALGCILFCSGVIGYLTEHQLEVTKTYNLKTYYDRDIKDGKASIVREWYERHPTKITRKIKGKECE